MINTVNVLEITGGNFQSLRAFPETPEGNKEAEEVFRKCVKENWDNCRGELTDETLDSITEDGHFEECTYELLLVHSGN